MSDSSKCARSTRRRQFIASVGAAGIVGLAGCGGDGGDGGSDGGDGGSDGGDGGDSEATGTSGSTDGSGTITLGALNPFSGGLGWIGGNARRGYNTALHQINDNSDGVLDGMTIEINEQDSQTNPQEALSGFETLAASVMTVNESRTPTSFSRSRTGSR
jgi:ABC-type branched-subunit amino acid transport system substrate-binding protein